MSNAIGLVSACLALAALLAIWAALRLGEPRQERQRGRHRAPAPERPQDQERGQLDAPQRLDPYRARWARWARRSKVTPLPPLAQEADHWGAPEPQAAWCPPEPWERAHLAALDGNRGLVRLYVRDNAPERRRP